MASGRLVVHHACLHRFMGYMPISTRPDSELTWQMLDLHAAADHATGGKITAADVVINIVTLPPRVPKASLGVVEQQLICRGCRWSSRAQPRNTHNVVSRPERFITVTGLIMLVHEVDQFCAVLADRRR
jgi:hypothetical protein